MKRKTILFFVLAMSVATIGLFFLVSRDDQTREEVTDQKHVGPEQKKDKASDQTKKENRQSGFVPVLPFSEYESIYDKYNDYDILLGHEPIREYCDGKASILEFIFLRKNKQGEIEPYPITSYGMWKADQSKGGMHSIGDLAEGDGVRFMITVGKNCKESFTPNPGVKYILKEINEKEKYHYPIKIPEKNDLTYRSEFTGVQMVYRYPILMNEVLKTREDESDEESTQQDERSFTLTVTGFGRAKDDKKKAVVRYLKEGKLYRGQKTKKSEAWKFEVDGTSKKDVLGGSVAVYEKYIEQGRELVLSELSSERLLKYKKNIKSFNVDMTEDLDFHHKNHEWVQAEVRSIGKMILEKLGKNSPSGSKWRERMVGSTLRLAVDDPNQNLTEPPQSQTYDFLQKRGHAIFITTGPITSENDVLRAGLNAPAGTYDLFWNNFLLEKNFKWPPKD